MENTTVETPGTVALEPPSTVLNPETVKSTSGGGKPDLSNGGSSIQDVLQGELSRLKEADAAAEADVKDKATKAAEDAKAKVDEAEKEPKAEPKAEKARGEDGKFAKAEKPDAEPVEAKADKGAAEKPATERAAPEDNRQSEGRKYAEPPARFLPEARTKWANVPHEVKAEFHRISQEMDAEIEQSKAARERYEPIRQFDEIARQNGRELKDSLAKVVQIEQHIARDPIGALDTILREIGPRKQDGSPVSLYEVAQVVLQQGPQAQRHAPQMQPANDPQVSALAQELNALKSQMATAQVTPMLERFASEHHDYHAMETQIASVLQSGVIEQLYGNGLSPEQKLAEAYRMAGGNAPSRSVSEPVPANFDAKPAPSQDRKSVDAGTKSIRGAPDDGHDPATDADNLSLEDTIRKELRKFKSA